MKFKVKLRLTDSSGTRKKYSINLEDGSKFMIGRGTPGLGTDLSHPSVSSSHCYLSVKDGLVWVTDNQSRNGTFLNHKRIEGSSIRVGDILQLGEYMIEFLEAPMPAQKGTVAGTQFIDIAEMSAEEQEALKRVGAIGGMAAQGTQVMSRSGLFSRKSLEADAAAQAAAKAAAAAATAAPPPSPGPRKIDSRVAIPMPAPRDLPSSGSGSGSGSGSVSVSLSSQSESAGTHSLSSVVVDLTGSQPGMERNTPSELDQAETSKKELTPVPRPEVLMPPELMPTGMIQARAEFKKPEASKPPLPGFSKAEQIKTEILKVPPKLDSTRPESSSVDSTKVEMAKAESQSWNEKPPSVEQEIPTHEIHRPLPDIPKAPRSLLPPKAPEPSALEEIDDLEALEPVDDESSAPLAKPGAPPGPRPSSRTEDDEWKKNQLVSKHLKKPAGLEAPSNTLAPVSTPKKKSAKQKNEKPNESNDPIPPSLVAARSRTTMAFDSHTMVSAGLSFASFAACGTAVTILNGPMHLWIPPLYGAVGAAMMAGLAWLLSKYNEFMESDGEFSDYFRVLALASVPIILLGVLSRAPVFYRIPAYVLYGVIFFNVFMNRFKPLAERFLFLAGSYVASFAFVVYVATSWDSISGRPDVPEVAFEPQAAHSQAAAVEAENTQSNRLPAANPQQQNSAQNPAQNQNTAQNTTQNPPAQDNQTRQPAADSFAMSELLTAAQQGDSRIVRSLILEKGVNPNTVAENGMTALMYAAYNGHLDVANVLLSDKADPNMKDRQGTTALMWAAYNGKRDMSALLIQSGADVSAHRNDGDSALDIARRWEHTADAEHNTPAKLAERTEVVKILENPAVARSMRIPSEGAVAAQTQTQRVSSVRVTTPPAHRAVASTARKATKRKPAAAAAKAKRSLKSRKRARDSYSATDGDDDDDEDDSSARAKAVKSLKIGQ